MSEVVEIVSVSGGKDSTCVYLWAIERFGKDGFKAVFADKLAEWEKRLGRTWIPPGLVPGIHISTIDDVRFWSKTRRGGREIDVDAPNAADAPSCMATWGVCE